MLAAREVSVEVGGRLVVERATFTIQARDKVGLVGRNGAGKTSLLKVLGGAAPSAGGSVQLTGGLGYLPQDPRIEGTLGISALTHVLSGRGLDEAVVRIEKLRLQMEEDPSERAVARFSKAEEEFADAGGYAAEADVRKLCSGLGLAADRVDLPLEVLSGGERRRVELARILFAGSDVLLLDEPTNHLDVDAKSWLLGFLRGYRGALLVISHDLELLDEAITRVIHLDRASEEATGGVVEYRGTYSQYKVAREKDEVRLAKVHAAQQKEITRLSTLADSMRGQTARRARVAKSLDHRVERLEGDVVEGPAKEKRMRMRLPDPPHSGRVMLEVEGLAKGYGGPPVFTDVSFDLGRGERLMIMGLNGAGKTTLLRILAGATTPDRGTVKVGFGVSAGYYAQEHETVHAGRSLIDHLRQGGSLGDEQLRALLGTFSLTGAKAFQDAGTLSGGEKTKLALGMLVAGRHNLLLLDEPTNNLDPASRQATAEALGEWPGSMILVSHDREFVEHLKPNRVLMMPEGTLDYWTDDLSELVDLA